jgi:glutamate/aspartate transport system substrate-binding protein
MVVIFLTSTIAAARAEQVSALGQKHDGIIVASDPNRGPNFTRDMVDALNRIDPSLRLHVKDGYASLRRVDIDLALGDIDAFFGLRKSDDRTKVMNFLDEVPLYCIDYRLAVRMEEQAEPRSFDDVRALGGNAVILAIQGRLYAHLLKQQPDLSVDDGSVSAEANLQKLLDHRGRFFYADSQLLKYAIQKLGLETSVRILPTIFESDVIYAVTSKFLDPELARNFRTAVQSMEQNGELATIRAKNNVAIYKSGRGQGSVCAH